MKIVLFGEPEVEISQLFKRKISYFNKKTGFFTWDECSNFRYSMR